MKALNIDMRDAFFDKVYDLVKNDKDIMFITADHGAFSLVKLKNEFPDQYINIGVAEQNAISVASGLALSGKKVFVYGIINFITLRCLEQIIIDLAGMNLNVTIVGVGAGFTYSTDGPTHQGIQDVSVMASVPGLSIFNSSDAANTSMFAEMAYKKTGTKYVRIEKGIFPDLYSESDSFESGLAKVSEGCDLTIVSTGIMVHRAMEVAEELKKDSISAAVIDLYRLKPVNEDKLLEMLDGSKRVVTLEEHLLAGGMGSIVSTILTDHGVSVSLKRFGIEDRFCFQYSNDRNWMQQYYGLGKSDIVNSIRDWIL